jgi:hypothetical protein
MCLGLPGPFNRYTFQVVKLLFIPFSVVAGLAAGFAGKKIFEQVWGVIDDREPPEPEHRDATWAKVVIAAALEGAVFKGVRAAMDRSSRTAFASLTGTWPGGERPEPE